MITAKKEFLLHDGTTNNGGIADKMSPLQARGAHFIGNF
jgi:hypothetical protein